MRAGAYAVRSATSLTTDARETMRETMAVVSEESRDGTNLKSERGGASRCPEER